MGEGNIYKKKRVQFLDEIFINKNFFSLKNGTRLYKYRIKKMNREEEKKKRLFLNCFF